MKKTESNIRSSYKYYCKHNEDPVDIKTYIELVNNYNLFLMNKVFEGYEVTLPARFGTLMVTGKEQEIKFNEDGTPKLPIDWGSTWQLWKKNPEAKEQKKKVYHTNEHSSNIRYKFFWSKKRILATNKNLYSLRMTRANKRELASLIKDGKEYYVKK